MVYTSNRTTRKQGDLVFTTVVSLIQIHLVYTSNRTTRKQGDLVFTTVVSLFQIHLVGKKQFIKSPWLIAYVFIIITSLADWLVTVNYKCTEVSILLAFLLS